MKVADLFAALRLKPDKASFEAGNKLIGGIKTALGALAAWKGLQWAKGTIQQVVDLGGHIADLSQKIGVPAEDLQQLGFAADQSGSSMDALGNSIGKLAKKAYDASKGNKESAASFRKIGVSIKEADGSLRPAADLLEDIADHIAAMPDGTEKTAVAMDLFGRSGKDLIPLLNAGGEGIRAMREEFVALGAQIDGETASSLEEFGDQQDKIKVAIQGLKNQAVIALLPQLKEIVKAFLDWIKANRTLIKQGLQKLLSGLLIVTKNLARAFGVLIQAALFLAKEWRFLTLVLAGLTAAVLVYKAASIGAAIASAAAWVMAAAPFLAIAAAIALVALLAEDIWTAMEGGDSVIGDIHKALVGLFVDAIEFWVQAFDRFIQHVKDTVNELRDSLPEFMGGRSLYEQATGRAPTVGTAVGNAAQPQFPGFDAYASGLDFFSPEATRANEVRNELSRLENTRRQVDAVAKSINISAPLTINVQGGNPDEIKRQITETWQGVLRTTNAALGAE